MNIVHVNTETWDSGLSEYMLTLASAQKKSGDNVLIIAPKDSYVIKKAQKLDLAFIEAKSQFRDFASIRKSIKAFKPDIINAHTGSAHTYSIFLSMFGKNKPKIVRTRGDAAPVKRKPLNFFIRKNTHGLIAANSKILLAFQKLYGFKIPSELIFQGVKAPKPKGSQKPETPTIGMLSRLDPVKGHKVAITAALEVLREIPNAIFRFAGEDKNVKASDLKEYAKSLGIENKMIFEGFVKDKFEFINGCTLGIIPSIGSEAVSRSAIEWMSQGKAVVASNVGGLSDIISHEQTGLLVKPDDPTDLAKNILALLKDEKLLAKLEKAASLRYEEFFDVKVLQKRTKEFYQKILK
jgi:glycosyltransferase involved in cell wall biosynthesis